MSRFQAGYLDQSCRPERPLKAFLERDVGIVKCHWQAEVRKACDPVLPDATRNDPSILGKVGINVEANAVA